jgi:hypothetical protein
LLSDLFLLSILFKEEPKDEEVDGDSDKQSQFTARFPFSEFEITISNLESPTSLKPLSSVDSLVLASMDFPSLAMSLSSLTAGALQTGQLE